MTEDEAIKLLRSGPDGVRRWNLLREKNTETPDLVEAKLGDARLLGVDLTGKNLRGANLRLATMNGARLRGASLIGADLNGSRLVESDLRDAWLNHARLDRADLAGADLRNADLSDTNLAHTCLIGADLRSAWFSRSILADVNAVNANFNGARFDSTIVSSDLSEAVGLDTVFHAGPSIVNVNSVLHFKDSLPEKFLRGCGLRDEEIAYFRSQAGHSIRFCSCFISYGTADEAFASRLYNDLQTAGIRCWKWDHDARTGKSLWGEIDQAIRVHDKLVLIASESSLKSPAVNREIERAIRQEDERLKQKDAGEFEGEVDVLFPVRVDDYILEGWEHERKVDVIKKVVADARGWDTDPAVYAKVRDRLIRDLKPE